MNPQEILNQYFSESEVETLTNKDDFKDIITQIEQLHANQLLDDLEQRSKLRIDSALNLDAKWEAFRASIHEIQSEIKASATEKGNTEEGEGERVRKIEEFKKNIKSKIQEAGNIRGFFGGFIFDWIQDTQNSLQDSKGIKKLFGEISLKIGEWFLGVLGFKEIYKQYKTEIGNIKIGNEVPQISLPKEMEGTKDLIRYQAGIELIVYLSHVDDKSSNIQSLFLSEKVQKSSFEEIVGNNFSLEGINAEDILLMKNTLLSQEELIDSILKNENPEWKKLTLGEIFKSLSVYTQSFTDIRNIHPENIIRGDFTIGNLSFGEDFQSGGSIAELFEREKQNKNSIFYGVSEGLFLQLFREKQKKVSDSDLEHILSLNSFQGKNTDKAFQKEFVSFGRSFIDIIISNFYLGPDEYKQDFANYFQNRSLSLNEILEFMVLTGASLDVSKYNNIVKTIIYAKIWKMLGESPETGNSLRVNTYNHFIITASQNGIENGFSNVPPQFITIGDFLVKTFTETAESTIERSADYGLEFIHTLWNETSPEFKISVAAGAVLFAFIMVRSRYTRGVISGGMAVGSVAILSGLILMVENAITHESFLKQYPGISKEQALNKAIQELTAAGIDMSKAVDALKTGKTPHDDINRNEIAPVPPSGTHQAPDHNEQREYPWIILDAEQLKKDGMSVLPMEGDLVTQEFGDLKIVRDRAKKEIHFYVQNNERNVYFGEKGGFMDRVADGILADGGIFTKNTAGKIFLAVYLDNKYIYLDCQKLAEKITKEDSGEIPLYEDMYFYWDLMMEGNN